jgi:FkbM family methyltransferase
MESKMLANIEYADLSGFKLRIDHDRYSSTMIEALRSGVYEAGERRLVAEIFAPGDRILEVGSSVGSLSMIAASIVGSDNFIGYEANPELMPDALENFRTNNMTLHYHNAVLRNRYNGGGGGNIDFHVNKDFWISSLTPSGNSIRTISVPVLCLEDEIGKFKANCLLLDIEGAEVELLENANLNGIEKIFMEVHYWPSREGANRMLKYLINQGFNLQLEACFGANVSLHRNY